MSIVFRDPRDNKIKMYIKGVIYILYRLIQSSKKDLIQIKN